MTPITPLEPLEMLRILGLSVRLDGAKLFVSPAGLIDDDVAWLVRTHRAAIIAELKSMTEPRGSWLLHFADREPLEAYCHPAATHAAILERYPDALAAEPLQARARREPSDAEAKELRALVQAVAELDGWDAAKADEATALALADPDGALTCYRDAARDIDPTLKK